ncbi:DUF6521 family protein [Mesorhizobium sp. M0902]|uniref:three component ABC system middle component n=1 Tax=unclassified Mesorhizobium TaxID=325217 RepID=UPI003334AE6B
MASLEPWSRRPAEEANLFNPAFMCGLIHELLKDFTKGHPDGAPLTTVIVALTTSLHRASRETLPHSTVRSLYEWLQENERLLIGFATRAKNLSPYIKEAILFGMTCDAITVGDAHALLPGIMKAGFPKGFLDQTTSETKAIIDRTKFMGRWLSKSGSEVSIAAAWGIKP